MNSKGGVAGRRTGAQAARTRKRILDRAERLFAERGYRGVTTRQLAEACNVSPYTIQHHFGSKPRLFQEVLDRWDGEVSSRLTQVIAEEKGGLIPVTEAVVDELFDFLLEKRNWVRVASRVALGEAVPGGVSLGNRGWTQFMASTLEDPRLGAIKLDLGLLLITVEGLLNHHILSQRHYRQLYGKDLSDAHLRLRTKQHVKTVIAAILESNR